MPANPVTTPRLTMLQRLSSLFRRRILVAKTRPESPDGKILMPGGAEVVFTSDSHQTAYFATAEVYVTRLLDRTEFRKHCDKHKTYRAIISNLE